MKKYKEVERVIYDNKSKDPYTFKFYNPKEIIMGKTMKEQCKFALAYWHTMNAAGTDMFGGDTQNKNLSDNPMENAKLKVDLAFDMMKKLQIEYYCFHDVDVAPEGITLEESVRNLDEITNYLLKKQKETGIKLLWATVNNFSDKRFMNGAASSNSADVFAYSAGKVKAGIDACIKLGGTGYVFWGGREGYETLLNTNTALENDNLARLFTLARDYGRSKGFKGDFYLEPKPKEPTKHQYDFDACTCANFLRKYDLIGDFKLNIESNHATLAGHTFQHELRMARDNGIFGSIDANQGDMLLGWDTDQFPTDVYNTTYCMYEVLKEGGFTNGGLNFDAKTRRPSNTLEDTLLAFIAGMDAYALGLRNAAAIIEDERIDNFVEDRYSSYKEGIGKKIINNEVTLEELADYAKNLKDLDPGSGRQEYLENIVNEVLFTK